MGRRRKKRPIEEEEELERPKKRKRGRPRKKDTDEVTKYASREKIGMNSETQKGILIVFLFAIALLFILSLFNMAGSLGEWLDIFLIKVFGSGKYLAPIILLLLAYFMVFPEKYEIKPRNYVGLVVFILSFYGLIDLISKEAHYGGYVGYALGYTLEQALSFWGALVVIGALFIASWLIMFNTSLTRIISGLPSANIFSRAWYKIKNLFRREERYSDEEFESSEDDDDFNHDFKSKEVKHGKNSEHDEGEQLELMPKLSKKHRKITIPLDLLIEKKEKPSAGDIHENKDKIRKALENFGIDVEMGDVSTGPTVTQYSLKPSEGVKISQITTLSNDLALALAAHPVRIEAPIPGKGLVGIEVPNKSVAIVGLKEMLSTGKFQKERKSNLTICMGRDVAGKSCFVDLGTMPHLLIAGATGSGKSVCINSIIMSLLYQNGPDDLKLILVDPKRVEFTVYNDIPYLLTPVITDTKKCINALRWVVAEMDRRYEVLSKNGKRDVNTYNAAYPEERMPYIVLVVDELADLMATSARDVEAAITRLAQMARAVGIHLVLATQRPSVDVITGLIKANITSRVAFNVASVIDSRTILDHSGAEKLLGKGDMLYISASLSKPRRLQGALLLEEEIEKVANFLKGKARPLYDEEVTQHATNENAFDSGSFDDSEDELLDDAKEVIMRAKKASASLLQRRLRIGYARAARILDILEEQGIIGPADGAKPREILIKEEDVVDMPEAEKDEVMVEDEEDWEDEKKV
ncbi:MAG: DNA translocase FtsK 4TM domain-containing protein [Patescibacteria group bacterium]